MRAIEVYPHPNNPSQLPSGKPRDRATTSESCIWRINAFFKVNLTLANLTGI